MSTRGENLPLPCPHAPAPPPPSPLQHSPNNADFITDGPTTSISGAQNRRPCPRTWSNSPPSVPTTHSPTSSPPTLRLPSIRNGSPVYSEPHHDPTLTPPRSMGCLASVLSPGTPSPNNSLTPSPQGSPEPTWTTTFTGGPESGKKLAGSVPGVLTHSESHDRMSGAGVDVSPVQDKKTDGISNDNPLETTNLMSIAPQVNEGKQSPPDTQQEPFNVSPHSPRIPSALKCTPPRPTVLTQRKVPARITVDTKTEAALPGRPTGKSLSEVLAVDAKIKGLPTKSHSAILPSAPHMTISGGPSTADDGVGMPETYHQQEMFAKWGEDGDGEDTDPQAEPKSILSGLGGASQRDLASNAARDALRKRNREESVDGTNLEPQSKKHHSGQTIPRVGSMENSEQGRGSTSRFPSEDCTSVQDSTSPPTARRPMCADDRSIDDMAQKSTNVLEPLSAPHKGTATRKTSISALIGTSTSVAAVLATSENNNSRARGDRRPRSADDYSSTSSKLLPGSPMATSSSASAAEAAISHHSTDGSQAVTPKVFSELTPTQSPGPQNVHPQPDGHPFDAGTNHDKAGGPIRAPTSRHWNSNSESPSMSPSFSLEEGGVTPGVPPNLSSAAPSTRDGDRGGRPPGFRPGQRSLTSIDSIPSSPSSSMRQQSPLVQSPRVAAKRQSSSTGTSLSGAAQASGSSTHKRNEPGNHTPYSKFLATYCAQYPTFEPSIFSHPPMEDIVKQVADFLYGHINHNHVEIEAKLGRIVDLETNLRIKLPVKSETIMNNLGMSKRKFKSDMAREQHHQFNCMLNSRVGESVACGYKGSKVRYKHVREVDMHFSHMRKGHPVVKIRQTRDQGTNEVVPGSTIRKVRVACLDVFNPRYRLDYRITVSTEEPVGRIPPDAIKEIERYKDRLSYSHEFCRVDLTQVRTVSSPSSSSSNKSAGMRGPHRQTMRPDDVTHEVEVEFIEPDRTLRLERDKLDKGQPNFFFKMVQIFLNNVRLLAARGSS